jgi:prepilin-type N-terminal cleavage/methylation domain-containing protein
MPIRRKAFTLIELSITLLVIAACMAIAFPKFSTSSINRRRLQSAANKIAAIAQYTRHRAVTTQSTHHLSIDTQQGSYNVTAVDSQGNPIPIEDGIKLNGSLAENLFFDDILFSRQKFHKGKTVTIEFNPQGSIEPVEIYIANSDGKQYCVITKEISGKIETIELQE